MGIRFVIFSEKATWNGIEKMSVHNGAEITMASLETHDLSQGFTNLEKRFPAEVEVFEGGGHKP